MRARSPSRTVFALATLVWVASSGCWLWPFGKAATAEKAVELPAPPRQPTEEELRAQDLAKAKQGCESPYWAGGIELRISGAPDLNFFNGLSHTLYVVVYQLSDPNAFSRFLETSEGIGMLLEGKRFDASVLSPRPVVVQPGQTSELKLDRVEGARSVGVVAGYYNQQPQQVGRVYPIPMDKVFSPRGVQMECTAGKLSVDLRFESEGIAPDR